MTKRIMYHPGIEWPPAYAGGPFSGKGDYSFAPDDVNKAFLREVRPGDHWSDVDVVVESDGRLYQMLVKIKNGDQRLASNLRELLTTLIGLSIGQIGEREIQDGADSAGC